MMGIYGTHWASLHVFRDFLSKSNIYSADIDENILFKCDQIKTFKVDQLNLEMHIYILLINFHNI